MKSDVERGLFMDVSQVESEEAAMRISKLAIPDCLKSRPLVMGDPEQVKAVRALERRAEKIVELQAEGHYESWSDEEDDDEDDESRSY